MSDFDYSKDDEYTETPDPNVDKKETNKNIKLLNEIVVASSTPNKSNKKTKKTKDYDAVVDQGFNFIKEPLYLILLYLLLHTKQFNNLLIRHLPKVLTDPSNFFIYYGFKGVLLAGLFLILRYKC